MTPAELNREARGAYRQGRLKDAWQYCQQLNQRFPEYAPGWDICSRILLANKQAAKALEGIELALKLDVANPLYQAQKVYCLMALHRTTQADALTEEISLPAGAGAELLDTIGNLYSLHRKQDKALLAFQKAVALEPGNAHFWINLALTQQALGDLPGAESSFNTGIALRPSDYEAWLHRSRLRKQTPEKNHIEDLEKLVTGGLPHEKNEVVLRYALAKEYEDIGDYARSFQHLRSGADLRRSQMRYNVANDLDAMDRIAESFSSEYLRLPKTGYESEEPIFIVGLPRTGTTLLERIVGSHSKVYAAGELNSFAEQLTSQVREVNPQQTGHRAEFIADSTKIDFRSLGKGYIERTRPQTGHTPHFVDKLPLNFLYCGLIAGALPQAKIIHITRRPMDTCYAIYKTLFKQAYPFSYDLQDIGRYYIGYRKLMSHWHSAMPGRILDVSYESLVLDQETVSRQVLDHCGLGWENNCLEFYKNDTPSMTASLAQVRQPVYASSIDQWKKVEQQLRPLAFLFNDNGINLD